MRTKFFKNYTGEAKISVEFFTCPNGKCSSENKHTKYKRFMACFFCSNLCCYCT